MSYLKYEGTENSKADGAPSEGYVQPLPDRNTAFNRQAPSITLEEIIGTLGANEKTLGEHTRRLFLAGLIRKKYRGKFVEHTLSPYGNIFVRFLRSFQRT